MGEAQNQPGAAGGTGTRDLALLSFEEALGELEDIVKSLEGGRGTLAQAIADYERGAALRRHCETKLAEAEMKVQAIVEGPGGPSLRDVE
ncbi:exodeoxyribonuclease VII small subunit [Siccirubricoccus sp. G192]|uniref:exodeoxyribonuclease VII small subunit n=1 Tax=Siccirubricoccus sp. G192 TaxID=2849651 RepID=UPI001C2C1546|nr:exodeoxyribonuclease VII small subunit [Siccirubricoccus sp. G192]MBV1799945.1 exodeoxyribonuclease VII small subunit [Siccirubricoccus sp. G192]